MIITKKFACDSCVELFRERLFVSINEMTPAADEEGRGQERNHQEVK